MFHVRIVSPRMLFEAKWCSYDIFQQGFSNLLMSRTPKYNDPSMNYSCSTHSWQLVTISLSGKSVVRFYEPVQSHQSAYGLLRVILGMDLHTQFFSENHSISYNINHTYFSNLQNKHILKQFSYETRLSFPKM